MKKALAALFAIVAVTVGTLSFASSAQAYPGKPPKDTTVVENKSVSSPTVAPSTLPNTGGPDGLLLTGGAALLVVGAGSVLVSRKKQNA